MILGKLKFVTFKPDNGRFTGFLEMEAMIRSEGDTQVLLQKASKIYGQSIARMCSLVSEVQDARAKRKRIPARKIWEIGDAIFKLRDDLEQLSLELNGLYGHLTRDLAVKQKWLEKVVILRRYLPDKKLIPRLLNWGRCEKGTRRVAQKLSKGLSLD